MTAVATKVGQRPSSLLDVARLVNAGRDFGPTLAEFLDEARLMDRVRLESAMSSEPGSINKSPDGRDGWQDAYLAAVAEHLSREFGATIPEWTEQASRFLSKAWFDNQGLKSLNAMMVAESPLAFRRRFIFTEARPLRRA
jgi:hypothetical protein